MNGDRYERQLVNRFDDLEWAPIRMGSSGGGTKRPLPDVMAMKFVDVEEHHLWAIELKSTSSAHAYVEADEVEKLRTFTAVSGFTPYLAARFSQDTTFYLRRPEDCYRTDAGSYRLSKADANEEWSGIRIEPTDAGGVVFEG